MSDSLVWLIQQADRYCGHLGSGSKIMLNIYREESDWAFIIKIDALHETASRDLMSRHLLARSPSQPAGFPVSEFVEGLPYQGRSSILKLLKLCGCAKQDQRFLDCTRRVRNAFAHDIRSINKTIFEIIDERKDRSELFKAFSCIEDSGYDEAGYVELVRSDHGLIRFGILRQSMILLYLMHFAFPKNVERPSC